MSAAAIALVAAAVWLLLVAGILGFMRTAKIADQVAQQLHDDERAARSNPPFAAGYPEVERNQPNALRTEADTA